MDNEAMTVEKDALGFEAPAPLGHPGRVGMPEGLSPGPEVATRTYGRSSQRPAG